MKRLLTAPLALMFLFPASLPATHAGQAFAAISAAGRPAWTVGGCHPGCGSKPASLLTASPNRRSVTKHSLINTRIEVPSAVEAPLGSTTHVTVQVTADGSQRIPTGKVALWNRDIPSVVKWKHYAKLDAQGKATFALKERLPGIPFEVTDASVYYVPKRNSGFSGSTSGKFALGMHLWPAGLSVTVGRDDGNGKAVPIDISMSGTAGVMPAGDLSVTDVSGGQTCVTQVQSALPYRGSGQATLNVDLPLGNNTLSVRYLGDAYFAPQQSADSSLEITTAGWSSDTCPKNWARLAPGRSAAPLAGGDLPMVKYGFPRPYGEYSSQALANPQVGTMVVQLDWSDVEPSVSTFDFAPADAEVRAAISQGKKVALVLRFQAGLILSGSSSSCAWNFGHAQLMPRWAVDALPAGDSFCSHGTALTIPKYWSATFTTLWTSFVDRVAAHFAPYASDIAYVRGPVGLGDEAKAITGPNSKPTKGDLKHLLSWGYNPQLWEAWQEDMLLYYHRAFSYAPWVLYTINQQDVNNKCSDPHPAVANFASQTIPCTGKPVEVDVGEWAVDHGFGLAQNSLDSSWIYRNPAKDDPPGGDVNTVLAYALAHSPRPFVELETFQAESYWCNAAVPKGLPPCKVNHRAFVNMEDDVSYARAHGVSTIEWYEDDLNNPTLQPVIDLWRQLQAIPGQDRIPTTVSVTPSQQSVRAGAKLTVTVRIAAPGIAGFIPGGTVLLSDDITGRHLKVVHIHPDRGTATITVKVPATKFGHINLSASYKDTFKVGGHRMGTWLWRPSISSNAQVVVTPAS